MAVVCALVAVIAGASTGQVFADPRGGVERLDEAPDRFTDLQPGKTLYVYAPEGTDIVHGLEAYEAAGNEIGGTISEYDPPSGWPGGCEFEGLAGDFEGAPELYVTYTARWDTPVEFEGQPYEPILTVMNGSTPGASFTVECETEDLVVAIPTSETTFQVHWVFWPAVAVGAVGLVAALAGGVALAVLRPRRDTRA